MKEIWKDWPEFPGYQISNTGKARTTTRFVNGPRGGVRQRKGRSLKLMQRANGYLCVRPGRNGVLYKRNIHRVVYELFIGELKEDMVVMHLDGDKENNHMNNLQQGTQSDNAQRYHGGHG